MTHINVTAEALRLALKGMGTVISSKSKLPVLQHIKLSTTEGEEPKLDLFATDLDQFLQHTMPCVAQGDAFVPVCVDCFQLKKLVNGKNGKENGFSFVQSYRIIPPVIEEEKVVVEERKILVTKLSYTLGGQRLEVGLNTLPAEEFPLMPESKGEGLELDCYEVRAMAAAHKFGSTDESRYVLNGVALDGRMGEEGNAIVATDGRRLQAITNVFLLPNLCVIIPSSATALWWLAGQVQDDDVWSLWYEKQEFEFTEEEQKARKDEDEAAKALDPKYMRLTSGYYLTVKAGNWKVIAKEVEGQYPNWKQAVPGSDGPHARITLTNEALDFVINSLPALPDNSQGPSCKGEATIQITSEGEDIFIKTNFYTEGVGYELVGFKIPGATLERVNVPEGGEVKPVLVALNRRYFTEAIGERFHELRIIDELSPLHMIEEHKQHVVMPMRLS